jgi:peroxiredoxin
MSIALACLCLQSAAADQPIKNFTLGSHRGVEWSLDDVADQQLVVVAFLGTECPLANLYGPRLVELQQEYNDKGVAFVGVNSNTHDSLAEIATYVTKHKIAFPMLKDPGNRIADQFKAERTPEVFLLDKHRNVRYRGRIDDQYLRGLSRGKIGRRDLAVAIDELLVGKPISVSHTAPIGCHIGRVQTVKPHGDITYSKHIAPIINQHCVECHRKGQVAPFALGRYEDVIGWEDTIVELIYTEGRNSMPPWYASSRHDHEGFSNDARLSDEQKRLISKWVANGMPEGDKAHLPPPPQFVEGWKIPEPDVEIYMPAPFNVAAEGIIEYQHFEVPGWDEDKYVIATEARPGNTAVVHHIIVYVIPPVEHDEKKKRGPMLVGYAPGATPRVMDEGTALFVPAGSTLEFELHYTPNGTPQTDLSYVGVKFTEKENVTRLFKGDAAVVNRDKDNKDEEFFMIDAHDSDASFTAKRVIGRDQMLLDMTPHMHLRGKSFRFVAQFPNMEDEQILLDVPKYDFNWQLTYKLAEPLFLKKGTVIRCDAAFDNSRDNPALLDKEQPDDKEYLFEKDVGWGRQSWDEMMIGFFSTRDPRPEEIKKALAGGSDSQRTGD